MFTVIMRNVYERGMQSFKVIELQQPIDKNANKTFQYGVTSVCQSVSSSHKRCYVFVLVAVGWEIMITHSHSV